MKGFCIDLDGVPLAPEGLFPALRLAAREIGQPKRDDYSERVPFSSVTWHFEDFAAESYAERTLSYTYELLSFGGHPARAYAERVLAKLKRTLRWHGWRALQDASFPDYFFEVRQPVIGMEHPQNGVYQFTFTFAANPAMLPHQICSESLLKLQGCRYPDVNGDGFVTGADAARILTAAENIAAGGTSGLTPAQELLADADCDGSITEADALLVQEYAAAAQAGYITDSAQSWHAWLQRYLRMKEAVY